MHVSLMASGGNSTGYTVEGSGRRGCRWAGSRSTYAWSKRYWEDRFVAQYMPKEKLPIFSFPLQPRRQKWMDCDSKIKIWKRYTWIWSGRWNVAHCLVLYLLFSFILYWCRYLPSKQLCLRPQVDRKAICPTNARCTETPCSFHFARPLWTSNGPHTCSVPSKRWPIWILSWITQRAAHSGMSSSRVRMRVASPNRISNGGYLKSSVPFIGVIPQDLHTGMSRWCNSLLLFDQAVRDIKPHNFVLTPDTHTLLIDFGSAAPLLPPKPDGSQIIN